MVADEQVEDHVSAEQVAVIKQCLKRITRPNGSNFTDLIEGERTFAGRYAHLGETGLILPSASTSMEQVRQCYVKLGDSERLYFLDKTGLLPVTPDELIIGHSSLSELQRMLLEHLLKSH
jgi:hypothetical protein